MDTLVDLGHVSSESANKAQKQYSKLIDNRDFISETKKFSISSDRVDEFYARILNSPSEVDLIVIVHLCLILSHGSARVESGFSINENLLQVNIKQSSIVSQRLMKAFIEVVVWWKLKLPRSYKNVLRARTVPTKLFVKKLDKKKAKRRKRGQKKGKLSEMKSNMQQIDAEISELNKQLRK